MLRKKGSSGIQFMLGVLIFTVLLTSMPLQTSLAAANIRVLFNGANLDFDVPPMIENGRTIVPFRKIGEAIGAKVDYEDATKTIKAYKDGRTVALQVGNTKAYVDQREIKLDMPPVIEKGRTLVPLRFFSEAFGASVAWNDATRTVTVNSGIPTVPVPGAKPEKYILGYYYSQSYNDFIQNYDKMSATATKWYCLDANGDVTDKDDSRYITIPDGYEDMMATASDKGLKTHMLIFESDGNRLEKVLSTLESRKRLVNQIMTVVEREGFDGVNIDFEYLKAADKDRFGEFIQGLYEALKDHGKSLNLSLPVKTEKADWWPGYDYETLGKYSDFVVLMAYDKDPANPGPQAGIDWVEEIVDYTLARIPAEKVVLGLGYYGYDWSTKGRGTVLPSRNEITYSAIIIAEEVAQKYNAKFILDEKSLMAYAEYTDAQGVYHQIWMETDQSVAAKAKLVINKGLKGVALWRLGYSTPGFWNALTDNFTPSR